MRWETAFVASDAINASGLPFLSLGLAIFFFSLSPSLRSDTGPMLIQIRSSRCRTGTGHDSLTYGARHRCQPWRESQAFSITPRQLIRSLSWLPCSCWLTGVDYTAHCFEHCGSVIVSGVILPI